MGEEKGGFLKLSIVSLLILCCYCCKTKQMGDDAEILKEHLNVSFPNELSDFNSAIDYFFDNEWKPSTLVCKFKIPESAFNRWLEAINIPFVDTSFQRLVCRNDEHVKNKITTFELHDYVNVAEYEWWDPLQCGEIKLYASFYNSKLKAIVRSFAEKWDGRVSIGYCKQTFECYLIVETFL